jgi:hypothetical protein
MFIIATVDGVAEDISVTRLHLSIPIRYIYCTTIGNECVQNLPIIAQQIECTTSLLTNEFLFLTIDNGSIRT